MNLRKLLYWLTVFVVGFGLALVTALMITIVLGIRVNLDMLREHLESAAASVLDREVNVTGAIELVPSLWPTVQVENVGISNPREWNRPDFARVGMARLQFGIVPLFNGASGPI